jgi:hypothetical protein
MKDGAMLMEKVMLPVKVEISDAGFVCISQESYQSDNEVILHPSQVPTVIGWLQDTLNDLSGKSTHR